MKAVTEILKNKVALGVIALIVLLVVFYFLFWRNRGNGGSLIGKPAYDPSKLNVDPNTLPQQPAAYEFITDAVYEAMNAYGTDEDTLFYYLDNLNANELAYVAQLFGRRPSTIRAAGVDLSIVGERNIFQWFDAELSGSDLSRMRNIWTKTGLWG